MDDVIRQRLRAYLDEVTKLPNEAAKTHRFAALVSELFPGTRAPIELAQGIEKIVRVSLMNRTKLGRIDSYYGNAVIEFENSIAATHNVALEQLREYTAGIWTKGYRQLICVATDGVVWRIYRPKLRIGSEGSPAPHEVELEPLREIVVAQDTLGEFWLWLTGLLFRKGRTEPTAERFRLDFSLSSPAYADAMETLEHAWTKVREHPEAQLAFDTWKRYLTVTYGSLNPGLESLFLKHTYLASVARLLIWASITRGATGSRSLRHVATNVLSGEFFRAQRIDNMVEDDFFHWVRRGEAESLLVPVWERTLDQLLTYDFKGLAQDILKGVYQELVDPEDRHDLGEYYTPDWLCERMVLDLLPPSGFPAVLDPACGSGSFLRAAIAHVLRCNPHGTTEDRLRSVLDSVMGIDIHPLAVTIARATYLLAIRDLLRSAKRPVQVPVYLADSLFLPTEVTQLKLDSSPSYEIAFEKKSVAVPEDLVNDPELFDAAISAASSVAVDHATTGAESKESLYNYLEKISPALLNHEKANEILESLWNFTEELADLIRLERNSIWAFIVRNSYRPAMLRQRFDFVVGNPPWLAYRFISDPAYQREIELLAVQKYKVASRDQRLKTQMELATVFLVHSLATFGKSSSQLGFVMPWSVLSGDQHQNFRVRSYDAPVTVTRYWDLAGVSPLFGVPCCVLFASRESPQPSTSYTIPCEVWSGRLPEKDLPWKVAEANLSQTTKEASLIYIGERTALSTEPGSRRPNRPSAYSALCHQGATIVPRNCYFVEPRDLELPVDPDGLYWIETEPEQARAAKEPYRDVYLSGEVEGRFLLSTAISKHLVPFALTGFATVALPVALNVGRWQVQTAAQLRSSGYRAMAKWMAEVEALWVKKRGKKADKQTPYEWLDYHGKLSRQGPADQYLVLYNHSGTNVSAAFFDRMASPLPFVVDVKLYEINCSSADEGNYLAAVLNSSTVDGMIKPFQSLGLAGERDIHKKVFDLPIPRFASENAIHRRICDLGRRAAGEVEAWLSVSKLPRSLARRRAMVRDVISECLQLIDAEIARLF